MKPVITLFALVMAGHIGCGDRRTCVKSHEETIHRAAWTSVIFIGKMMMPIFHPAADYVTRVCDEYAPEATVFAKKATQ